MEVDAGGNILRTWNLADIISAAMIAGGDDPHQFVYRAPIDWFHNNACAYRSSDNSLIVSSRENFVIALDYDSGMRGPGSPYARWLRLPATRIRDEAGNVIEAHERKPAVPKWSSRPTRK